MLRDLARNPAGLPTPELAGRYYAYVEPHQQSLTRCGNTLRRLEARGWIRRAGIVPGEWQRGPAVIWQATEAGAFKALRAAVTDLRATPLLSQVDDIGEEIQQVIQTLRIIISEKPSATPVATRPDSR